MENGARDVTAVVAAFNEATRIGQVLEILTSYPGFAEVIVVDDGSTDGTAEVAGRFPVRVIEVKPNRGKGGAMDVGVREAKTDVIFFADADIIGLDHEMIRQTVTPVVAGECEMFILMRNRRIYYLHRLMAFVPLLGGERAVTRQLWETLPDRYKDRFRIEAGLNFYAIHYGKGLRYRVFKGITQTVKEAKFGWREGMRRRFQMFGEVIGAAWDLQWNDLPPTARARRAAAGLLALTAVGMTLGMLVTSAGISGPWTFFWSLFDDELREDPDSPIVRLILRMASGLSATAVLAVGVSILLLNAAFFLRTLFKVVRMGSVRQPG